MWLLQLSSNVPHLKSQSGSLTMSSLASLAAVTVSTIISGTTVVNQDSEEIWGITWVTNARWKKRSKIVRNGAAVLHLDLVTGERKTEMKRVSGSASWKTFIIWIDVNLEQLPSRHLITVVAVALVSPQRSPFKQRHCLTVDEATSSTGCDTALITLIHMRPFSHSQFVPLLFLTRLSSLPGAPAGTGSRRWQSSGTAQTSWVVGRWRSCTWRFWWRLSEKKVTRYYTRNQTLQSHIRCHIMKITSFKLVYFFGFPTELKLAVFFLRGLIAGKSLNIFFFIYLSGRFLMCVFLRIQKVNCTLNTYSIFKGEVVFAVVGSQFSFHFWKTI